MRRINRLLLLLSMIAIALIGWRLASTGPTISIGMLVNTFGPPDVLGTKTEFVRGQLDVLRITTLNIDPSTFKKWDAVSNVVAVWIDSKDGKIDAHRYYEQLRNDPQFDGGAWYSSRSVFGEKATVREINDRGCVDHEHTHRFDALSIKKIGWKPPPIHRVNP